MIKFQLELVAKRSITETLNVFFFKKVDNNLFDFIPGQFITFFFESEKGFLKRRSYSIANLHNKDQEVIEIVVSYVSSGLASDKFFTMDIGQRFLASGPYGKLLLSENLLYKRLFLVGTGTGIVPYRSMLKVIERNLLDERKKLEKVQIILGVRFRRDILYAQDFLELSKKYKKISFKVYLSREKNQDNDSLYNNSIGYVQDFFNRESMSLLDDLVYLCGNPNMVDSLFKLLREKGLESKNIKREKYISSN